jgi:hypothetical protein
MRRFDSLDKSFEAYLARVAGDAIETQTARAVPVRVHYATREPGLILPAGQAFVTAALVGLAVLVVGFALGWFRPWLWALVAWALVLPGTWLFLLADWRRLIHRLEDYTGRDLDQDFVVGEPEHVRVEISENNGQHVKFLDLPCSTEQLSTMAREVLRGVPLSEAHWIGVGKPFNRGQFAELRSQMLKRGLLVWNVQGAPARGCSLTSSGRAAFRYLAHLSPSDDDLSQNG